MTKADPNMPPTQITFRPAMLEDKEPILKATRATYAEHQARQPDFFRHDPNQAMATGHIETAFAGMKPGYKLANLIVAEGRPQGLVGYVLVASTAGPMRPGFQALLFDIWVAPDWRRRGIGRALLAQAEDYARDAQASQIDAMVWDGNAASDALFGQSAFRPAYLTYRVPLAAPKPAAPRNTLLRLWDSLSFVLVIALVTGLCGLAVVGGLALLGRI